MTARLLGGYVARDLGQPVIVDNRPGGGAIIGYELAARAPADGHTLLLVFPSFVIGPALRAHVAFDPTRDFRPVSQTINVPMAIAVEPSLPVSSLADLVAYARSNPGKLSYGTAGTGTLHHILGEMLKQSANIEIVHVPFSGEVPAMAALVGGHLPMALVNVSAIAPHARVGKARVLVVTTPQRDPLLPDVPTMREAGYPELEATNWSGLVVGAATPADIVSRLNAELVRVLRMPEVQEKLQNQGLWPAPSTPEQFDALLQTDRARYSAVVRTAGIRVE
ncbi:MAG TPA: tripartite tricarboxylate transporter substrate binding protein [Casimicrobiaceae bacterium]|nr:tripartite tricarboxylate transporter substrate binding protein [Casimicrobiaceae bacterium]